MPITKAITLDFLKRFFGVSRTRSLTARTLSHVILRSLRLFPVALAAQIIGMGSLVLMYWETEVSGVFLLAWFGILLAQVILSLGYVRSFWRDATRVKNVRKWVRRWTFSSIVTGSLWGLTGIIFVLQGGGILQVMTVAICVAVTFAGWPVYSCWMPSLTAFTLLTMTPLTIAVAGQYRISSAILTTVLLVVTGFILYSGRKLNELITASVLADAENMRLVERLRIEVTRSENARRATQKDSERRARFFAAANHDLRQPLQAMGIYLDILKHRTTPQTEPVVEQLALTSGTISTLVEQVLEVTRMEFGGYVPHPERLELEPLFRKLEIEYGPTARAKGLVFRTVPTDVAIETDEVMLERALKNLITNAINYANPERRPPEIVVAARRVRVDGRRLVRIGVYDCGDGMTSEERARVFEAFYRGEAGKRRAGSGFGLGLSIVHAIAKTLNAELTIDSKVGRGSVFRLGFPETQGRERDDLMPLRTVKDPARTFSGTIALVEDNPILRNALVPMFESRGATVLAAAVPDDEFFASLAEKEAELSALVTDYNLGDDEMTGLEVAALVEARLGRSIPVVVLTAVAQEEIEGHYRTMREGGALALSRFPVILQKPAETDAIFAAIWSQQSGPQPRKTDKEHEPHV